MLNSVKRISRGMLLVLLPLTGWGLSDEVVSEYWNVAMGRAEKIVSSMDLPDEDQAASLVEVIATQYRDLFVLHEVRDQTLKQLTAYDHGDEAFNEKAKEGIETASRLAIERLHRAFIARLSAIVGEEGVEAVKNGMTYNVAPNTYQVYLDMLPELDEEGRSKIKAWLIEAREYAMDAGSSHEKHKWFGKYKGRINNYLSFRGYDMKAAEKAMWERKKKESGKKEGN